MQEKTDPRKKLPLGGMAALLLAFLSLWQLERLRSGIEITGQLVGATPVVSYARPDATGPVIVIAHGFAGSQQMMQAYALTFARAGYRAYTFDFLGHGRNPVPMSGDVTVIDGTTRLLVEQTLEVLQAVAVPGKPTAVLGHSMATDILIRTALDDRSVIGPIVLLSAFSRAITAQFPADMLLISGQWEKRLRDFGVRAAQMVIPEAEEGQTVQSGEVRRSALVAPYTEHVSILHSRVAQRAALDWVNEGTGWNGATSVAASGWWLVGLLFSIVVLGRLFLGLLPQTAQSVRPLQPVQLLAVAVVPAVMAPLLAPLINPGVLPVLVADYLALHLGLFGCVQLLLLLWFGQRLSAVSLPGVLALVFWALGVFGLTLDRYGANFVPGSERLWVIAALCLGTLPFMLADALATAGGTAKLWHRLSLRIAFFVSLAAAVALDFEGLFFLILIAPVMVLFYAVFGVMGRWTAQRVGVTSVGIGLAIILAWALGVSFPFFASTGAGI